MELFGAQRLILKSIHDLQGDSANLVSDAQISEMTKIALPDIREWLLTLRDGEWISLIPTTSGFSALIKPKGQLALKLSSPIPMSTTAVQRDSSRSGQNEIIESQSSPVASSLPMSSANVSGSVRLFYA